MGAGYGSHAFRSGSFRLCGSLLPVNTDASQEGVASLAHASLAKPLQAAWISAASVGSFALSPIGALLASPANLRIPAIAALSLSSLGWLGAIGGYLGDAPRARAALRVTVGGALAMLVAALIGKVFGVATG